MARKFIGEIIPYLKPIYSEEVALHTEHWKNGNLSITDVLLLSCLEDLIYSKHGSLLTTKKSLHRCLSSFLDCSEKTVERFVSKMLDMEYICIVPDKLARDAGLTRLSVPRITDDIVDYLAYAGPEIFEQWMLQYVPEELKDAYAELLEE